MRHDRMGDSELAAQARVISLRDTGQQQLQAKPQQGCERFVSIGAHAWHVSEIIPHAYCVRSINNRIGGTTRDNPTGRDMTIHIEFCKL